MNRLQSVMVWLYGLRWRRIQAARRRELVGEPNIRCRRRHPGWKVPL